MRRIALALLALAVAVLLAPPSPAAADDRHTLDCTSTQTRIDERFMETGNGPKLVVRQQIEYVGSAARPPGSYRFWHMTEQSVEHGPVYYFGGYAAWCGPNGEWLGTTDLTRTADQRLTGLVPVCGVLSFGEYTYVGSRVSGDAFRYWGVAHDTGSGVLFGVDAARCY